MVEEILKINLTELMVVRVTCNACHATTEISVDDLGARYATAQCPHCMTALLPGEARQNPFDALRLNLKRLRESDRFKMEFVIPVTS